MRRSPAYARAIELAAQDTRRAGPVDHLDVGGASGRLLRDEPPFERFVQVIRLAVHAMG
ncbi:MAG: hypothetical protein U1E17_01295 [Geminicoccaceae bacterium]